MTHESMVPDWAQAARAMRAISRHVDADGSKVHYLCWGDPRLPPLVLVHGNAAHAEWWRFIAPLLAKDYYVLALDLGGMGDSAHNGRYSREHYADQIMAVAAAAAPGRKPFIAGHSMGGFVTILAGAAYGDRIAGIIVIDSPIDPPGHGKAPPTVRHKSQAEIYKDLATALTRFRLVPEQPVRYQFYLDHIARHSLTETEGGWRWKFDPAAVNHPRPTAYAELLPGMRCPAALIIGECSARIDDNVRAYMLHTLGQRMPVIELANSRHHVMLDEPLALVSALRTQLSNWRAHPKPCGKS